MQEDGALPAIGLYYKQLVVELPRLQRLKMPSDLAKVNLSTSHTTKVGAASLTHGWSSW